MIVFTHAFATLRTCWLVGRNYAGNTCYILKPAQKYFRSLGIVWKYSNRLCFKSTKLGTVGTKGQVLLLRRLRTMAELTSQTCGPISSLHSTAFLPLLVTEGSAAQVSRCLCGMSLQSLLFPCNLPWDRGAALSKGKAGIHFQCSSAVTATEG